MSIFREFPMYSPFERAKIYKGFTFTGDADEFRNQLTNFASHKTMKWIPEAKTSTGLYQPIPSLEFKDGLTFIRTNASFEIENGDIVQLRHPAFKEKFFIITGSPQIDNIMTPKWQQTYQHLTLNPISFDEPNVERK